MATVHVVKAARKDYPNEGIKKGESYFWWEFRYGGKYKSKTRPHASQLTQSEFLSQAYGINEELGVLTSEDFEGIEDRISEITDRIRQLGEECQEKFDNMPEGLQQGDTGQTLENRVSSCEDWAGNLEGIDLSLDEDLKGEDKESRIEEIISEVQGCQYEGE